MNYANIKFCDIANGPGVRTSLFVSGCRHHCKNCFNTEAWDFNYGRVFSEETLISIIESLKPGYISGITLLGGEPLDPANQEAVLQIVERIRREYPDKSIWCYTGYIYDEDFRPEKAGRAFTEYSGRLLENIDVLVDGPFVQELYDIGLRFRGSSNQRIIDLKKSRLESGIVLWEDSPLFASHELTI